MSDSFGKLVVRSHTPKRRMWLWIGAVLGSLLVLYAVFELGRYDAGFRVVDAVRGALTASGRIRGLEAEVHHQRTQLEAAEVQRRIEQEGYKRVAQSLDDMQGQIGRLNQDLSFYRGLVQPDSVTHVKVQQMQMVPGPGAGQYHLKFVLMQTGKPEKSVVGRAAITLAGTQSGQPVTLTFAQVTLGRLPSLAYSFRYFQEYDEPVVLPQGFEPTRVDIDIRSGREKDASHGFRQAFVWKAQGMSVETEAAGNAPSKGAADVQTQTTE